MPTEESLQTAPGSGDTEVARQPRHITDIFHPNVCKTTLSDAVAMGAPEATATGVALPPPPGLHSLSTSLAKDESPGEVAPGVEPFSSECVLFVGVPRTLFCCLWQAPLLPRENMAGNGTQLLMRMRGGRDGNNADLRCCPLAVTSDAMQHASTRCWLATRRVPTLLPLTAQRGYGYETISEPVGAAQARGRSKR